MVILWLRTGAGAITHESAKRASIWRCPHHDPCGIVTQAKHANKTSSDAVFKLGTIMANEPRHRDT